jgi:hypothetical protein
MIYMVDHVYKNPATEAAWHEWYTAYLQKLIVVPGIYTAQRFKALDCAPPRYLAMYSIESPDVYKSAAYRNMGGGGSQSVRFHDSYQSWTRNLFEGAARAPAVRDGQRLLIFDRERRDEGGPLELRAMWLTAVGLHMTMKYRAFVVLDAVEATAKDWPAGSFIYEPITPVITSTLKPAESPDAAHTR